MAVKNAWRCLLYGMGRGHLSQKAAALSQIPQEVGWKKSHFIAFQQYLFANSGKNCFHANKKGIEIVGDIPIYVAFDSADTWANPKLFQLDKEGRPIGVAGCPPDCFSETGQLWGNPLYDWKYHKKTGYEWWMQRIAYCYQLYDVLRTILGGVCNRISAREEETSAVLLTEQAVIRDNGSSLGLWLLLS